MFTIGFVSLFFYYRSNGVSRPKISHINIEINFQLFRLKENQNGQGYFHVESCFLWPNEQVLQQDSIVCQTVLSKCLGRLSEWATRLEVARHSSYNVIHFTPIQRLYHLSNSSYSITDHHQLNPTFEGTFEQMKSLIDMMAEQWRIFSITDLVYNHVANDCPLLDEYPHSAYNLINSPHLKPAALVDSILIQLTIDAAEDKLQSKGIFAEIKQEHFQSIRHYLLNERFVQYRLWEYFICPTDQLVEEFRQQLSEIDECPDQPALDNEENIQLQHGNYQRMKTSIDLRLAEKIYYFKRKHFSTKEQWQNAACDALTNRLHFLNHLVCEKLNGILIRAVENCLASCQYHFFAADGPKYKCLFFPSTPFVGSYFHYPNGQFKHPDQINELIDNDFDYQLHFMAQNGWVINDNPLRSFADPG